jgi:hypothetical protein
MRLVLPIPEDWDTTVADGVWRAVPPGSDPADPGLVAVVSPIQAIPSLADPEWIRPHLSHDLPAGASLRVDSVRDGHSLRGWPCATYRSAVVDRNGRVVEQRMAVAYRLHEMFAIAELRATSQQLWDELAPELGMLFLGAHPDWSGPIVAAAQLWE